MTQTQDRPLELDEIPIPVPLLLHPQVRITDLRVFSYLYGAEVSDRGVLASVGDLMLATGAKSKAVMDAILRLRSWNIISAEPVEGDRYYFHAKVLPRPWTAFEKEWRTKLDTAFRRRVMNAGSIEEEIEHQVREQMLVYWCVRNDVKLSPITGEYRQEQPDGSSSPPLKPPTHEELIAMYPEMEPTFRELAREFVEAAFDVRTGPRPPRMPW